MCDKLTIKDVEYSEEAFCEHCYDLPPYTVTIEPSASYCIDCAEGSDDVELSEEDLKVIEITQLAYQVRYYKKLLGQKNSVLINLMFDADDSLMERLKDIPKTIELE